MTTASPFQRRKCHRILEANDLSRRELVSALAEVEGLEDWVLLGATTPEFMPTSIEAVLTRVGTERVLLLVEGFFESGAPVA